MIRKYFLLVCCLLFLGHQVWQKCLGIKIELLDSYLDNLVCMPILLSFFQIERQWLLRNARRELSLLEIFGVTLLVSLVVELLFPYFSNKFTYDNWDFVAYGLGAVAYHYISRKNDKKVERPGLI